MNKKFSSIFIILGLMVLNFSCAIPRTDYKIEASYSDKSLKVSRETKLKYNEKSTMFIEQVKAYRKVDKEGLIKSPKMHEEIQKKIYQIENFEKNHLDEETLKARIKILEETIPIMEKFIPTMKKGDLEYLINCNNIIKFGYKLDIAHFAVKLINNTGRIVENLEGKIQLVDDFGIRFEKYIIKADTGVKYEELGGKGTLTVKIFNLNPNEKVIFDLLIYREYPYEDIAKLKYSLNSFRCDNILKTVSFRAEGFTAIEKKEL